MWVRSPILRLALALAFLVATGAFAWSDASSRGGGGVPEKNFSYVHADIDWVVSAFRNAKRHAGDGDYGSAVRELQTVIDATTERETPGSVAPYVVGVDGGRTFEGAFLVARHEIARMGDAAIQAYEAEFGGAAEKQAQAALEAHDPDGLEDAATRFLGTRAGRAAALLRIDLALEAGDRSTALAWLEALEDLEDVSAESEEAAAGWRAERIRRHADALAKDAAAAAEVRTRLEAVPPGWTSLDMVPWSLRFVPPPPKDWPTTAGDARRSAVPPATGGALQMVWSTSSLLGDRAEPRLPFGERPSVWLPPRAVVSGGLLFVSDGQTLLVLRVADGKLLDSHRYPGAGAGSFNTDEDRREQLGMLEGHTLTIVDVAAAGGRARGQIVYAAVPDGHPWPVLGGTRTEPQARNDRLQAFHWDGQRLNPLWSQGGKYAYGGMDRLTRVYGAPVLYRGKLWIAGIRPGVSSQWEAWGFALDPLTGRVISKTHIGTGTPVRRGRQDEAVPTSPAADRGRVVVGTSLGMVAALNARDGRVLWVHRYDRDVDPTREKRNRKGAAGEARTTGFSNEPPVLALDRCFLTPIDGRRRLQLTNRPRGPERMMQTANPETTGREAGGLSMSIEHIAGVDEASGTLVLIGRGDSSGSDAPGPVVVAIEVVGRDHGSTVWSEPHPSHRIMEPWGRALMTAEEVFVSSTAGIAVYALKDGSDLGLLDRSVIPPDRRAQTETPYGNLIPVPGEGLIAVSAKTITYWHR